MTTYAEELRRCIVDVDTMDELRELNEQQLKGYQKALDDVLKIILEMEGSTDTSLIDANETYRKIEELR